MKGNTSFTFHAGERVHCGSMKQIFLYMLFGCKGRILILTHMDNLFDSFLVGSFSLFRAEECFLEHFDVIKSTRTAKN